MQATSSADALGQVVQIPDTLRLIQHAAYRASRLPVRLSYLLMALALVNKAWHATALTLFERLYVLRGRKHRVANFADISRCVLADRAPTACDPSLSQFDEAHPLAATDHLETEETYSCIEVPDTFARHFSHVAQLGLVISRAKQRERFTWRGLMQFTNLTDLDLHNNANMTDEAIASLTKLEHLSLSYCKGVTDACLLPLTRLKTLNLFNCLVLTRACLDPLTQLTDLNLAYVKEIDSNAVSRLTNLTRLGLRYQDFVQDEGIRGLTKLRSLDLEDNETITDDALTCLTQLTHLNLVRNFNVTDASLSRLTNLTYLSLCETRLHVNKNITDASLSRLVGLRTLVFGNNLVSDASLKHLTNLTKLDLGCVMQFSDASLQHLTNLTDLEFNFNEIVTDNAMSRLANLTSVNMANNHCVTARSFPFLTALRRLNLGFSKHMNDDVINVLATLPHFRHLNLMSNARVSEAALAKLTNLEVLQNPNFARGLSDVTVRGMTNLRQLDGHATARMTQGVIDTLTRLTHLSLIGPRINPAYLKAHGQLVESTMMIDADEVSEEDTDEDA